MVEAGTRIIVMRVIFVITCLLLFFVSSAQKKKKYKVKWTNPQLQAFVSSNKQLQFIKFRKNDVGALELKPDTNIISFKNKPYGSWYSMEYPGTKYLFERQFGSFPVNILLSKLDSLTPKKSDYTSYEGEIYADHIAIRTESLFSTKRMPVFRAVRHHIEYPGGPEAFTKFIQSKIPAGISLLQGGATDSALFFKALLMKKDSMLHDIKPLDSTQSELSRIIQTALAETKGWTPFYTGGFYVNAYPEIFVRLKKDGTIEADYRR
jgi:hypothetical protein